MPGHSITRRDFFATAGAAAIPVRARTSDSTFPAQFAEPPWEARPSTYWVWLNGFTDRARLTYELEQLRSAGFNAAYLLEIGARPAGVVPPGPAFFGPESVADIAHAVREATRLGIDIGFANASSWNSGGSWVGPEHASKGLYYSQITVEGPARFAGKLPLPQLPKTVPLTADGRPAYSSEVAVLALPERRRVPGFDFLIDLAPGAPHLVERLVLYNANAEWAVRDFAVLASETGTDAGDFREILRGTLEPHTRPQSFNVTPLRIRYVKLRILSGYDPGGRLALAEFEVYNSAGRNVAAMVTPEGRKTDGGLLRATGEFAPQREGPTDGLLDGRIGSPAGNWVGQGPPPPLVESLQQIVDLTSRLKPDGSLEWDVPEGRWSIYRFLESNNGQKLMAPSPRSDGYIIDHFSAEASRMHAHYLLGKLRAELGDLRRTRLKYYYACSYEARGSIWTPRFAEEFRKRRGYDPRPYWPVLAGAIVQDEDFTERFRIDYRRTMAELFIENFYLASREVAHEYGLQLVAESGGPGWPLHQVPVDALKALGVLDIPRGEFWKGRGIWVVKETASAAHIYGQRLVQMEAFTSFRHWQDGPRDLKEIADRAFCDGANHFVWHTMPHVPEQAGKPGWVYHAGTHVGPNETWWPLGKPFFDYLARCSWLLRQGRFVADIACYYGERGFNFGAEKRHREELGLPEGYDFDTLNSDVLLNRIRVSQGRLVLPDGLSYAVLVLPDRPDMDLEILERLEQLVREGALVCGPPPRRATSLKDYPACDRRVRELAARLWEGLDGGKARERAHGKGRVFWGVPVHEVLRRLGTPPDFTSRPAGLDYIHLREDDRDIYFVRNPWEKWIQAECRFRVRGVGAELADPVTGQVRPLPLAGENQEGVSVALVLPPFGSLFVLFRKDAAPLRLTLAGRAIAGNTAHEELPSAELDSSRGVFRLTAFQPGSYRLGDRECTLAPPPPPLEVRGPWEVRFLDGRGAPPVKTFPQLVSWTEDPDEGIRYYSGLALYRTRIELPRAMRGAGLRLFLELGEVGVIARVRFNGREAGGVWTRPFRVEITQAARAGANLLEVEVANMWSNRLTGDARAGGWRYVRTHLRWDKEQPLLPSGLLGPVRILAARQAQLERAPKISRQSGEQYA